VKTFVAVGFMVIFGLAVTQTWLPSSPTITVDSALPDLASDTAPVTDYGRAGTTLPWADHTAFYGSGIITGTSNTVIGFNAGQFMTTDKDEAVKP
jgi:hypothetical protein